MPSRDIKECVPLLQEFWPKFQEWYKTSNPDKELILTCTYRSPEEQQAIYSQNKPGHIMTRCDGVKILSNHNYKPSRAFDVAIRDISSGKVLWEDTYYFHLGIAIKECGFEGRIRWGGWWTFRDYPHFEAI